MTESNLLLDTLRDIKDDIKTIQEDVGEIRIVQAEQAIILEEHQKASGTNSERLSKIEDEIIPKMMEIANKSVNWKKIITWALGTLATLITVVIGILRIMGTI